MLLVQMLKKESKVLKGDGEKKRKKTIDKIEKNKITLKVIKCDQEGKSRSFLGKA